MTVIVGLETNVGEKAVVIGSDKLSLNGEPLIVECIRYIEKDPVYGLDSCFRFLEEKGLDKVMLKSGRKIEISEDNERALAHTGKDNEAHKQVSNLLLSPGEFLKNDSLLTELLFPLGYPKDLLEQHLKEYRTSFNLDLRLAAQQIPEVRRIFDIHIARLRVLDFKFFKIAYWDRNYHPVLSEYLFAKLFDKEPKLFDIALTGAVTPRQYFAKGCGAEYALEHMRDKLGTNKGTYFYATETEVKKAIDLEEAVKIAKGAVEYANEKSEFCKGFDYVILRREGIETHFSDKQESYEIDIIGVIDKRIKNREEEISQLKSIKDRYSQKRI